MIYIHAIYIDTAYTSMIYTHAIYIDGRRYLLYGR